MPADTDFLTDFWPPEPDPAHRVRNVSGPAPTPTMRRAEETTRVAREATDAATEKRVGLVAKLKAERLARDAAMPVAPKPARRARKA